MREAHETFPVSTQFNQFLKISCNFQQKCLQYITFSNKLLLPIYDQSVKLQLLQFCGYIQCCTAKNHFDLQFGQSTFVDFLFKVGKGTICQGKDGEYFTFKSAIFLRRFRFSMLFLFCISYLELLFEHKCFSPRKR